MVQKLWLIWITSWKSTAILAISLDLIIKSKMEFVFDYGKT
ncbi:hypothetical protein GAPWKB30_1152 [Gilliamella apicola]|nr:hypothetical protein GAPWKB30_1152 [Gilliamella apicola]